MQFSLSAGKYDSKNIYRLFYTHQFLIMIIIIILKSYAFCLFLPVSLIECNDYILIFNQIQYIEDSDKSQ